jgi:hypothetical protein
MIACSTSMALSMWCFSTMRGGHMRSTCSPALTNNTPLSWASATSFLTGTENSTPAKSPPAWRTYNCVTRNTYKKYEIFLKHKRKRKQKRKERERKSTEIVFSSNVFFPRRGEKKKKKKIEKFSSQTNKMPLSLRI